MTQHGVLVEVFGEGVLITGDSGVGKSETALELIKRGHRLVADDAVEIKRIDRTTLMGTAPELIRYYMELRGIGVIDARQHLRRRRRQARDARSTSSCSSSRGRTARPMTGWA